MKSSRSSRKMILVITTIVKSGIYAPGEPL
jgi:hypothetical protein